MFVYDLAQKVNTYRKARRKARAGLTLSPVRRIERTAPLHSGRYVAMTFDDGPCAAVPNPILVGNPPSQGLTEYLLDILKAYDAKGTFDVIGTTEHNYPDEAGKLNSFSWGGVKYDHYPDFKQDCLAGLENQAELARRMVLEGHELANHGYRHMLFGHMKLVYGGRKYFRNLEEVVSDLSRLHSLAEDKLGFTLRLARPPHYIDKIRGGASSYDAYRILGYNYLAASFDGGGWKPSCGDYQKDVQDMLDPLKAALTKDPDALNGQIIFQKDGCNMSRQTPIADALGKCLELLSRYGYKVVTASKLIKESPFEDLGDRDPVFEPVRRLANAGYCVGYRNNTFQPDRILTAGEFLAMLTPPHLWRDSGVVTGHRFGNHTYARAIVWAQGQSWFQKMFPQIAGFDPDQPVSAKALDAFLNDAAAGRNISSSKSRPVSDNSQSSPSGVLLRRDAAWILAEVLQT